MTHLYKLEKATIEMIGVMVAGNVVVGKFEQQWSLKSRIGPSLYGRCIQRHEDEPRRGRVLGANKIILPQTDISTLPVWWRI